MHTSRLRALLASLAFAAGCGGSAFDSIPATDAAADAPGADSSDHTDSAGRDARASDAGSGLLDAPPGDSPSGSDTSADSASADATGADHDGPDGGKDQDGSADALEAAAPDTGFDAGLEASLDAGLDSGPGDGSSDASDAAFDAEACVPILFFLDGDGDGYGGTPTSQGCSPPATGTWVTRGGDCDDSNATVNPGQSAYFAAGYVPTGKSSVSFDYDCDGQENESGSPAKASCGVVNLSCVGSGYIEASPVRSGAGVDPFCGSSEAVTCALTSLVCKAGSPYTVSPIACH